MTARIYPSYQDTNTTSIGSIIITFLPFDLALSENLQVKVNNQDRKFDYLNDEGLYATSVLNNDVITIIINSSLINYKLINVIRRDYTTDDSNGNNGIIDTNIITFTGNTGTTLTYTFTATTNPSAYNFEYRILASTYGAPYGNAKYMMTFLDGVHPFYIGTQPFLSTDFGISWNQITSLPLNASAGQISINGKYMIVGFLPGVQTPQQDYVYISNDYGLTWNGVFVGNAAINYTSSIQISFDGQYVALTGGGYGLWLSNDFGATWTLGQSTMVGPAYGVSMSSNGQFLLTYYGTYYRISSDYGNYFFDAIQTTDLLIKSVDMSTDGQYMSMVGISTMYNPPNIIRIGTSSNYGQTFSYRTLTGFTAYGPTIAISENGQYQYILGDNGGAKSTDYGANWTVTNWSGSSISCSSLGDTILIAAQPCPYVSYDYGVTFSTNCWPGYSGGTNGTIQKGGYLPPVPPFPTQTPTPTPTSTPTPGFFTARFGQTGQSITYYCEEAPSYVFSADTTSAISATVISNDIINTLGANEQFYISSGGYTRFRRRGTTNIGDKDSLSIPCPLPSPTPSPTTSPTPTATGTPTPTPTISPTPTPTSTPTVSIITSGLTSYLNYFSSSYPGTGSTWTNIGLSGSTYNATLVSSPTFTNATPGYFTFNGTNQYATMNGPSSGSTTGNYTLSLWVQVSTGATEESYITRGSTLSLPTRWSLKLGKTTANKFFASVQTSGNVVATATGTTTLSSTSWYNITLRWISGSNISIWVNGVKETQTNTANTNLMVSASLGWWLMNNDQIDRAPGKLSEVAMYFRDLSDAEILSNFNTLKSIYGY